MKEKSTVWSAALGSRRLEYIDVSFHELTEFQYPGEVLLSHRSNGCVVLLKPKKCSCNTSWPAEEEFVGNSVDIGNSRSQTRPFFEIKEF